MKKIIILLSTSLVFVLSYGIVSAATSFSFSVPEGQGAGNNEFYHGRCVRADIMLDTDGNDTGGADLEINYDSARIQIVDNDCVTPATTIYHESQYQNYVKNSVTPATGKIILGSYDNSGTVYNGSGRYAYFYFTVLDGAGNYDLDFEFTLSSTTDTNLAEAGSGSEILDQADSYTLYFVDDDDTPYVNNLNPNNAAVDVQVISNILYRLNDDDAGVDISTLDFDLSGANWGVTSYTETSAQVSNSCHTTNTNRVDYCNVTLNPSKNLYFCETNTVDITVSDLGNPTVHTLNNYTYSFDTEDDNDATTMYNLVPANLSAGNSSSTNIDFNIQDLALPGAYPGTGVDITTLSVTVSASGWGSQTYTTASPELSSLPVSVNDYGNTYDYHISIDPALDFPENTLVTVNVKADDYGCPVVNSMDYTYTFTTADTVSPVCDQFMPNQNVVNLGLADNITFRCIDDGVGIDINNMNVVVNGIVYTSAGANQFAYVGTPAEYFFTIDPSSDFMNEYATEVIINGEDFSHNKISQISYGLATGTNCSSGGGGSGGGSGGGTQFVCRNPEALNYSDFEFGRHKESLCIYNDCSLCNLDQEERIITKYNNCEIVKNYNSINFLSSKTKIPNTILDGVSLNKINSDDVFGVLVTVTDDNLIFEGDAIPNTTVTLMIESEPIIVTGLADNNGHWKIEMVNIFDNGVHSISAISMSEDNYILNIKYLTDFVVKRYNYWLWFWILLLILLIISILNYRRYRVVKNKLIKEKKKQINKKLTYN